MDMDVLAAIVALMLTLVGMVGTSVWVVAGIRSSIMELTIAVREVAKDLDAQAERTEEIRHKVGKHDTRIAILENRTAT